jgi:hypothetical protein
MTTALQDAGNVTRPCSDILTYCHGNPAFVLLLFEERTLNEHIINRTVDCMSMSHDAPEPQSLDAMLATLIARLAPLFIIGAGNDLQAAHDAARRTLMAYQPLSAAEMTLAAAVISFSLHSLAALGRAMDAEISLNQMLRLRGSAVSLSREAHKAQRKLDQMQKARLAKSAAGDQPAPLATADPPAASPAPVGTAPSLAVAPPAATTPTVASLTWTQAYHQRQREKNLARRLQKSAQRAAVKDPLKDAVAALAPG